MRGEHVYRDAGGARSTAVHPPRAWGTHACLLIRPPKTLRGSSPRCVGNTHGVLRTDNRERRFIPTCVGNTCCSKFEAIAATVHPHVRGEHLPVSLTALSGGGSSHVRGEHASHILNSSFICGSSPRAWGTQVGFDISHERVTGSSPRAWGTLADSVDDGLLWSVHPHVRGEHGCPAPLARRRIRFIPTCGGEHGVRAPAPFAVDGSSPRAWGTRGSLAARQPLTTVHSHVRGGTTLRSLTRTPGVIRFIPTCVGNTKRRMVTKYVLGAVHPHVRGEHDELLDRSCRRSSVHPHVRGEHCTAAVAMMRSAVHPHVRGEHGRHLRCSRNKCGSSPIVRGGTSQDFSLTPTQRRRFIPTCVGNTSMSCSLLLRDDGSSPRAWGTPICSCSPRRTKRVHPHVRWGTRPSDFAYSAGIAVHPLRAWGTRQFRASPPLIFFGRFIPTCVGNTSDQFPVLTLRQRTVHFPLRCVGNTFAGDHADAIRPRFIPTCVGNTHPCPSLTTAFPGSSPRAWGTLWRFRRVDTLRRFIPTCVGNTTPPGETAQSAAAVHSPRAWGHSPVSLTALSAGGSYPGSCEGNTQRQRNLLCLSAVQCPHVP